MVAQSESEVNIFVAMILGVLVVTLALGVVAVIRDRRARRRVEAAAERLRQLGYSVRTSVPGAPTLPFDEFSKPRPATGLHITQPGTSDSAFHFEYTYRVDKYKKTYRLSCAVVPVPFRSPGVSVWKSSRSVVGAVSGNRIETDSARFNSAYEVECADERFAYTMLSYEVVDWFLNEPAYSSGVTVRANQNWMLLVSDRVEHQQLPGLLVMAQQLRDVLPGVLASFYPLPQAASPP